MSGDWRQLRSEPLGEPCFYCERPLRKYVHDDLWFRDRPHDSVTIDHILPQSALRRYGERAAARIRALNKIRACNLCNNRKADTDPVEWAQMMGPAAVVRLASRFIEMGLSPSDIAVLRSGRAVIHSIIDASAA